jgi:uncharacterized protein YkwD
MPRPVRFTLLFSIMVAFIVSTMLVTAQTDQTDTPVDVTPSVLGTLLPPSPANLQDIFERISAFRARYGLPPYVLNESLSRAAQDQAEWLVSTHSRTHIRPDGSSPSSRIAAQGIATTGWCCGENYYMSIDATPELAFHFWIWSSHHLPNVVHRDFTDIGLGMSSDGYRTSYVTVFAEVVNGAFASNVTPSAGDPQFEPIPTLAISVPTAITLPTPP